MTDRTDRPPPRPDHRRLAWRIPRAGSLARLRLLEEDLPAPAPGEVQIDVAAVGLNFADIFACLGLYSATPAGSFVPGLEAAGTVRRVGDGVTRWRPGDRVIVLTRFGGYASALNVGEQYLWPLPETWSFEDGAAYPVQALTAWYGLVPLGGVRRGSVVLVQSAAGGVGLNALQVLRQLGAQPGRWWGASRNAIGWCGNTASTPPASCCAAPTSVPTSTLRCAISAQRGSISSSMRSTARHSGPLSIVSPRKVGTCSTALPISWVMVAAPIPCGSPGGGCDAHGSTRLP